MAKLCEILEATRCGVLYWSNQACAGLVNASSSSQLKNNLAGSGDKLLQKNGTADVMQLPFLPPGVKSVTPCRWYGQSEAVRT